MTALHSPLPGIKLLEQGPPGSGKTSTVRSWLTGTPVRDIRTHPYKPEEFAKTGLRVFAIFTEPSFEIVGDIPDEFLHWVYIPPAATPWDVLLENATKINDFEFDALANLKSLNKSSYREFLTLISTMNNYVCQRCGKSFGDVAKWGTDRVLWLDSLTGINTMGMNLQVGAKPAKGKQDWGVAMDNLERFLTTVMVTPRCHITLTAHIERETDEISGQTYITTSTLGRKLAPKIPIWFSDVVLARQVGGKFSWSTAAAGVDLKARNLPYADNIPPDIGPMLASWKSRGGIIEQEEPK